MTRGWKKKSSGSSDDQGNSRWRANAASPKEKEDKAYEQFADMIVKKLEGFKGDWQKPWFSAGLPWPKALYGKRYNGMNALMLSLLCEEKGYKIPVFATSARIASLNFEKDSEGSRIPLVDPKTNEKLPYVHVLKGETSFPVFLTLANVVNKETKEKISYNDYMKLSEDEKKEYNVYFNNKVFPVFAVEQTNIQEARPELYQKLLDEATPKKVEHAGEMFKFEPLDIMISEDRWVCPICPEEGDRACYSPSIDKITVPLKEQFQDGESFYGTLLHEMAHSTGHESRLNRLKTGFTFGDPDYAREELVAELTKAITCQRYNIDCHLKEDTLPYLKSWLKAIHEKPEFIKTVLNDVKHATGLITYNVDEHQVKMDDEQKLDGHEVDGESFAVDDDGILEASEHLAPDKKQGENESKEQNAQDEQRHSRWHR